MLRTLPAHKLASARPLRLRVIDRKGRDSHRGSLMKTYATSERAVYNVLLFSQEGNIQSAFSGERRGGPRLSGYPLPQAHPHRLDLRIRIQHGVAHFAAIAAL